MGVSNGASTGSRKGRVIKSGWPAHCCHHYPKTPHHPVVPSFGSLSRCFFPCLSMKGGPNPDRPRPPPPRTVPYPPAISSCAQRYWPETSRGLAAEKQVIFSDRSVLCQYIYHILLARDHLIRSHHHTFQSLPHQSSPTLTRRFPTPAQHTDSRTRHPTAPPVLQPFGPQRPTALRSPLPDAPRPRWLSSGATAHPLHRTRFVACPFSSFHLAHH